MPILRRKLLRDIAAGKARFLAVTFLVFLGLALYLSNWLGYASLDHSYKKASEELKSRISHVNPKGILASIA